MSKKVRIIISCILVVFAFGAGIFAYAQTYSGKTDKVNAEEGTPEYLVNQNGKIDFPHDPTDEEDREEAMLSRGNSETNPFVVLEIVPYEGMAEFGYLIDGQEPLDVVAMARNNESVPGGDYYYKKTQKTFYYWPEDKPENFKGWEQKMPQYGTMKYVPGGGQYSRTVDETDATKVTYTLSAGGGYEWTPLSAEECANLTAEEKAEYGTGAQTVEENESFKMYFNNVTYYTITGYTLEHKDVFLRESVGLAYEYDANGKRDYIRKDDGSIDEEEINRRVDNFHTEVFTVTPEDLNLNLDLIDRADMIVISTEANLSAVFDTYGASENEYLRKDKFGYEDEEDPTHGRVYNVKGATFDTNLLSWDAALRIYSRATNPTRICPIITDSQLYESMINGSEGKWEEEVTITKMFSDGSTADAENAKRGTQNNMVKLFLMMYQMTNPVLESFYGEVNVTDHAMFGSVVMKEEDEDGNEIDVVRKGITIETGTFMYNKDWPAGKTIYDPNSLSYWNDLTMYPWQILPASEVAKHDAPEVYRKYAATYGIMMDSSETYNNNITAGYAKNSIRNGLMQYDGGMYMTTQFHGEEDEYATKVKNNEYGAELYDFFNSITKAEELPVEEGDLTTADCLYYLLNGLNLPGSVVNNNKQYKILELQPSPDYEDVEDFWAPLIAAYTNSTVEPEVEQMTTSEFIGSHVECISDYDLIYVGMNKMSTDPTMKNISYVYSHTGPKVKISDDFKALYGWLGTNTRLIEKYFLYSGNDLTKLAYNKLKEYDGEDFPILYADGLFVPTDMSKVASTIDRNTNVYKLATNTTNSFKKGALYGSERERLLATLTTDSKKVEMVFASASDYPVIYDSNKPDQRDWYINGYSDTSRTLRYKFTVNAPAGTTYKAKLYVDVNTDGSFEDEELDITVRRLKANGNYEVVSNGTVKAGETYMVERTILDRIGSLSWKFCLEKGDKVYASLSGVSAIKANSTEGENIKVLQILPVNESDCVLFLPTESEIALNSFKNETSKTFYNKVKDVNGMNITFERRTQAEILQIFNTGIPAESLLPNPDYLNDYDMLVLGFADCYNGVSDTDLIAKIEEFIANGKAVLYTHDTSSGIGSSGTTTLPKWGATVTESYRELFGMDRYGAKWYKDNLGEAANPNGEDLAPDKDVPYVPASDSSAAGAVYTTDKTETHETVARPLIQGVANGMLYRTQYTENGGSDPNVNSYHVSRVNVGAITEYPYTIRESIPVESTHPQYYQLDMEDEEMVVWYCLDGNIDTYYDAAGNLKNETRELNYEKTYFGATKNDVRNNYYIYNRRNVTYTGMGHSVNNASLGMGVEEIELFVNTFVAAYRAAAKPVRVQVTNGDATSNLAGDQFICVDVDSSNATKIIGEDTKDFYRLQSWDAVNNEYVVSEIVDKKSKRVYFRLVDNNSYSNAEYEVTIKLNDGSEIDGITKQFAVFREEDNKLVDMKDYKFTRNTTDGHDFYVDVPITIETVGTPVNPRQVVGKTELTVTVKMKYKIGESDFEKTGDTKVNIMPRGLFDLD